MGRVGRPFKGRQREEERRQRRALRAQETPPVWKTYTVRVNVASKVGLLLQNQKNVTRFVIDSIGDAYDLRKSNKKLTISNNNLRRQVEVWERELQEYRHALGYHSEKPVRGCPACE